MIQVFLFKVKLNFAIIFSILKSPSVNLFCSEEEIVRAMLFKINFVVLFVLGEFKLKFRKIWQTGKES